MRRKGDWGEKENGRKLHQRGKHKHGIICLGKCLNSFWRNKWEIRQKKQTKLLADLANNTYYLRLYPITAELNSMEKPHIHLGQEAPLWEVEKNELLDRCSPMEPWYLCGWKLHPLLRNAGSSSSTLLRHRLALTPPAASVGSTTVPPWRQAQHHSWPLLTCRVGGCSELGMWSVSFVHWPWLTSYFY